MKKNVRRIIALFLVVISIVSISSIGLADTFNVGDTAYAKSSVNVRDAAPKGKIIYILEKAQQVTIKSGLNSKMYKVSYTYEKTNGTKVTGTGWVDSSYLVKSKPSKSAVENTYGGYTYTKNSSVYLPMFKVVQKALNKWAGTSAGSKYIKDHKITVFPLTVDGYCGANSVTAITAFQGANNLTADGKAGINTLTKMYNMQLHK